MFILLFTSASTPESHLLQVPPRPIERIRCILVYERVSSSCSSVRTAWILSGPQIFHSPLPPVHGACPLQNVIHAAAKSCVIAFSLSSISLVRFWNRYRSSCAWYAVPSSAFLSRERWSKWYTKQCALVRKMRVAQSSGVVGDFEYRISAHMFDSLDE